MANYYIYLISSLPALHFGMEAPFSFSVFLHRCAGLIPERDLDILRAISSSDENPYTDKQPILKQWHLFDRALRDELVKIRASRKKIDPAGYLRGVGYVEPSVTHIALSAYRNPSPLEAEKILDEERWCFLDGLTIGHYFDLDFLIVYGYKILILERWQKVRLADEALILEEVLTQQN